MIGRVKGLDKVHKQGVCVLLVFHAGLQGCLGHEQGVFTASLGLEGEFVGDAVLFENGLETPSDYCAHESSEHVLQDDATVIAGVLSVSFFNSHVRLACSHSPNWIDGFVQYCLSR